MIRPPVSLWTAALVTALGMTACRAHSLSASAETFHVGNLTVADVIAPTPLDVGLAKDATMAVYFSVTNAGDVDDTLTHVESPIAHMAMPHGSMEHDGAMVMTPIPSLAIPAHGVVRLAPGGTHVMLEGLTRYVDAGDSVPLTLIFSHAGSLAIRAHVVRYDQLEQKTVAEALGHP